MTERGALLGGRYQLDQIIGRGGMAEVWRARDIRLERDVAVKRLRVDLASDPTFQARFRREAQSAAGLNHPNIVAVYDTGEELDTTSDVSVPYIVMELVEGVTLREVLRDGRKILPERALEFTAGVLDALAYAHRAGIVHRDIKPANVMLTPNGTVKVMDFGIARAVADTSATMTQTAAVIGTAQYLSPEQARGEKVDNRSDIYSVGCLLYELLTSQPLFKGDSPVSVAYQHVREIPVPPSQLDSEITPSMDAIVLKSLEKDPRDRYQDASEMREDILRALDGQPVLAGMPAVDDQATRVISSDPLTTTARRGVVPTAVAPAAAAAASGMSGASPNEIVDEEDEEVKKSRKGIIALSIIAGVVLIGLIIAMWSILNPPATPEPSDTPVAMVEVPDLTDQTQATAESALIRLGLEVDIVEKTGTEENEGKVIGQNPDGGTSVEVGSTVTLDISQGPDTRAIPDGITGVSYDDAVAVLKAAGFTNIASPQDADPASEPIDSVKGNVISSNPASGAEVPVTQEITLTVATGTSKVPRLTGLTESQATREATLAGFDIDVTYEETDAQAPGLVFDQDPQPSSTAERKVKIKVKIAQAPVVETPETSPTPDATETTTQEPDQGTTEEPTEEESENS